MARSSRHFLLAAASAMLLAACGSQAADVEVSEGAFRPPLGVSDVGVGYFTIRSPQTDRLLRVSSDQARLIEMHASVNEGGMASMKRLDHVDLPAGQNVVFEAGGLHLMVFSPAPIEPGGAFPVIFELESGRTVMSDFAVISGPAGPRDSAGHSGH